MASLNHIGIAVGNLPALTRLFQLLGLNVGHVEQVDEQGVRAHFLPLKWPAGEGANIELLEPTDPEGTIAKFLAKRGPGIHHLSFLVRKGELDGLCENLRKEGYKLIYDKPKDGAHEMKVNFIHPSTAQGLLIEVMEPKH